MSQPLALAAPERILVRYGELALKGGNRRAFEQVLVQNLRAAVAPIAKVKFEFTHGRITMRPERRTLEVARRAQEVFGVTSVSPAWGAPTEPEALINLAQAIFEDALLDLPRDQEVTFRVRTRRADKTFPVTSTDFDRQVADRLLPGHDHVLVRLSDAQLELGIDIRQERGFVFLQRLPGPGGLPVGTLGRVLCLLSGGIDSPVAAWLAMKRGCRVGFVSFHSYPYIGEPSKKKVIDLARRVSRYQSSERLHLVPFTEVQVAIRDHAPEGYRTVLYRRMMQRIASRISFRNGYKALVTGECLGQVASQTLDNLTCIGAASALPVIRPLVTHDKEETIAIARRIGTYDISTLEAPDCCTVFQPKRPVIYGRLEECLEAEENLDVDGLVTRSLAGMETFPIEADW